MKVTRLALQGFTVFPDAAFAFAPGINVLIGENGTGKSHVLKLVYALCEATRRFAAGQGLDGGADAALDALVRGMLMGVFQPDTLGGFSAVGGGRTTLSLDWERARIEVTLGPGEALSASVSGAVSEVGPPLFVPPREVLSIFPGFTAAWLHRESAFDRTYFDLCVALELKPLRAGGPRALLDRVERELGGRVVMREGRFYVEYPGGDREMSMVAEGDRKLAMIAYLLMNGSLSENAYLLWDEPEANLHPKRARLTTDTAAGLAGAGVQVFLATHDYALTSELALKVDTGALRAGDTAFFALRREASGGVSVEHGERLAELHDNAILDALASLHAREEEALFALAPVGTPPRPRPTVRREGDRGREDYRGYPVETKKTQPRDLPLVIGCKVRDTVAGLVGASRSRDDPWVGTCARLLVERKRRVYVIAWVADPALRPAESLQKRSVWQKERSDRLKQRLAWLTPYVTVASPFDGPVGDVAAQSLAGAGQR